MKGELITNYLQSLEALLASAVSDLEATDRNALHGLMKKGHTISVVYHASFPALHAFLMPPGDAGEPVELFCLEGRTAQLNQYAGFANA